jgi:NAD(P)H-dependent FMN reductase
VNALLLVGSPKPAASASRSFGEALLSRLAARGATIRTAPVTPSFRSEEKLAELTEKIAWADLVVLSCPIYIDSLPAPVTRLLEAWATGVEANARVGSGSKRLALLAQCGFPEARHCDVAVDVCRQFCVEAGAEWAGALAFGTGGALEGRPIERSPLARAVPALDAAADALAAGQPIPSSASAAFAKPIAPAWVYTLFGGLAWWRLARKRGGKERLRLRRYPQ